MAKGNGSHGDLNFKKQIGQSATIQRVNVQNAKVETANAELRELGVKVNPVGPDLAKYFGSVAVHIFYNETLEQLFLVSQTKGLKLEKCPEVLAQAALTDLSGAMMETFGHKRPKLRSGF